MEVDLFSLGFVKSPIGSPMGIFLSHLKLLFKIADFQVTDDIRFYIVGSYTIRISERGQMNGQTDR